MYLCIFSLYMNLFCFQYLLLFFIVIITFSLWFSPLIGLTQIYFFIKIRTQKITTITDELIYCTVLIKYTDMRIHITRYENNSARCTNQMVRYCELCDVFYYSSNKKNVL